jgi:hypothetical protein
LQISKLTSLLVQALKDPTKQPQGSTGKIRKILKHYVEEQQERADILDVRRQFDDVTTTLIRLLQRPKSDSKVSQGRMISSLTPKGLIELTGLCKDIYLQG